MIAKQIWAFLLAVITISGSLVGQVTSPPNPECNRLLTSTNKVH